MRGSGQCAGADDGPRTRRTPSSAPLSASGTAARARRRPPAARGPFRPRLLPPSGGASRSRSPTRVRSTDSGHAHTAPSAVSASSPRSKPLSSPALSPSFLPLPLPLTARSCRGWTACDVSVPRRVHYSLSLSDRSNSSHASSPRGCRNHLRAALDRVAVLVPLDSANASEWVVLHTQCGLKRNRASFERLQVLQAGRRSPQARQASGEGKLARCPATLALAPPSSPLLSPRSSPESQTLLHRPAFKRAVCC